MPVQDVSFGSTIAGWLFGFDIDSHELKVDHRNWLEGRVVSRLALENAALGPNPDTSPLTSWHIWVLGGASRTGSFQYNLALSGRRGESVRQYLGAKMGKFNLVWSLTVHRLSEMPAAMLGRKDETENALDRWVLVILKEIPAEMKNPEPPWVPPLTRDLSVEVEFYFYSRRDSWFNVGKWRGELYAIYKQGESRVYDGWIASASGAGVGADDVNSGWVLNLPKADYVFAGPGKVVFPSAEALNRLNAKTIYVGTRGSRLVLRIEDAMPNGKDLHLNLSGTTSLELSQAVGFLKERKRLSEAVQRQINEAIQATRSGGILA